MVKKFSIIGNQVAATTPDIMKIVNLFVIQTTFTPSTPPTASVYVTDFEVGMSFPLDLHSFGSRASLSEFASGNTKAETSRFPEGEGWQTGCRMQLTAVGLCLPRSL